MSLFFVIGLNHKSAPVALREEFIRLIGSPSESLELLQQKLLWSESLFLSTCNRVEFYGVKNEDALKLLDYIKLKAGDVFEAHLYYYEGLKCVEHLFRVASSLDSMVVGEPQILGQVKEAYLLAKESGAIGEQLSRLFEKSLSVSKKIRSETEISRRPVSVGSVSVDLALQVFGDLSERKLLILGAGEMAQQVYKSAMDAGVKSIDLANRSLDRAQNLVGDAALAHQLEAVPELLEEADLLIASLSLPHFILTSDLLKRVMKARRNRPLFLIDLGLPRNIDPQINEQANIYLYNIDDLDAACEINKNIRSDEAIKAFEILEKEASGFFGFMLHKNPTIKMLGRKLESIRVAELDKTLKQLGHLSGVDKKAIEILTESLVNKILHDPMLHLKSQDNAAGDHKINDVVRRLFRLDEN